MKYTLALLTVVAALLCSCDPMRRINMKNESAGEAQITWTLKEDSALHSPLFISNDTKVKFKLQNIKPYNEAKLSYGSGSWTEAVIKSLADDLEMLEIATATDTVRMKSEAEIWKYLADRKKGVTKKRIHITLR